MYMVYLSKYMHYAKHLTFNSLFIDFPGTSNKINLEESLKLCV